MGVILISDLESKKYSSPFMTNKLNHTTTSLPYNFDSLKIIQGELQLRFLASFLLHQIRLQKEEVTLIKHLELQSIQIVANNQPGK